MPKGVSIPFVNLFCQQQQDRLQPDRRATSGRATSATPAGRTSTGFDVAFDYNQIPHNMGNDGARDLQRDRPGRLEHEPDAAQGDRHDTVDATPDGRPDLRLLHVAARADLRGRQPRRHLVAAPARQRRRSTVGKKLPFDLRFTYMRELQDRLPRRRAAATSSARCRRSCDVPEPLNEVTQDFGVRAAYKFKSGNVHASFNRNVYNNRAETLTVDNPFQAIDVAYTAAVGSTPALGGACHRPVHQRAGQRGEHRQRSASCSSSRSRRASRGDVSAGVVDAERARSTRTRPTRRS